MKLGVCYYPEHWPQDRWPIDAALMRQAGLSIVRVADFAWAKMEPREGEYSWKWLDDAMDTLAAEELKIVLCTPTASPPPWLSKNYPDILSVDNQGRRRRPGSRRHYCTNSPTYQQHAVRIASALATRYGHHPAVIGWQIDNEFGCHDTTRCYCENCTTAFRSWLEAKYGHIDSLNEAWGSIFWSQVYNEWSEIEPPIHTPAEPNPSQVLDYYRFSSDSFLHFEQLQISALKPLIAKGQFLTTNYMSQFTDLDYYDLASPLDFVTMSSYPTGHAEARSGMYMPSAPLPAFAYDVGDPYITGFGHTLMHGFKHRRPFWVMEQQCGNVNWSAYNTGVRPGTVRLWTWHALASGAQAVIYFRWRAGLYAQEQMHSGLLRHDASEGVGFKDLEVLKSDRTIMEEISAFPNDAQIALLLDYDSLWALRLQPHHRGFDYVRELFVYYRAAQRLGIQVEITTPEADLSGYKVVIMPSAYVTTPRLVKTLKDFTEGGGKVLFGIRSGFKNAENLVTDQPLPGLLRDLAGATVTDWHSLPPGVSYDIEASIPELEGTASVWAESLELNQISSGSNTPNTRILAQYTSGPFITRPAMVENEVGKGRAIYLGWYPDETQAKAVLKYIAAQVGIQPVEGIPEGVIYVRRGPYHILLNFTEEELMVDVKGISVRVDSRDLAVIRDQSG